MNFVQFSGPGKAAVPLAVPGGQPAERHQEDVLEPEMEIRTVMDEFGYDEVTARAFHRDMTYYSYGLAMLAWASGADRDGASGSLSTGVPCTGGVLRSAEEAAGICRGRENAVHQLFR